MKALSRRLPSAGLALASAALMCGCAPTHLAFRPEGGGAGGIGIVQQKFVEPYPIEATVNGQDYSGIWRSQAAPDHPLANSYLYKHEVGRVVTTLTDSNGKHLYCNWLVKSLKGAGTCEDDNHRKFDVTIN